MTDSLEPGPASDSAAPPAIPGLHHVTAIASDPRVNLAFYRDVLGLRLVKKTVNFDAPETYHLYYGDEAGSPGTIMTFFPWPGARRGTAGAGQATVTSFRIPERSISFWSERLSRMGVPAEEPKSDASETRIAALDPDGLRFELVGCPLADRIPGWESGPVRPEHAIRGFHGVTLTEADPETTAAFLTEIMGFDLLSGGNGHLRFTASGSLNESGAPELGTCVDVVASNAANGHSGVGRQGAGSVHHIAFRVADDEAELAWRDHLQYHGFDVSPVKDRNYFHSIYFREPGGVLFEIATDPPGFTADETERELGTSLRLPAPLEGRRAELEAVLPALE